MIGYLAFIALLFFPGAFLGLISSLFNGKRFTEIIALSAGISMLVVPLALSVFYLFSGTINAVAVYIIIVISLSGIAAFLKIKKIKLRAPKLTGIEKLALLLIFIQAAMLLVNYIKYPIFPESVSMDFRNHLQMALGFQEGTTSLMQVNYPPAIHLFIAALLSIENGINVVIMQYALTIIATLVPIFFFVVVGKLLKDQRLALIASSIHVFFGTVFLGPLIISGLYANIFANLGTLVVLILLVDGVESLDLIKRGVIFICGLGLYLSHYTIVIFIAALWLATPLVWKAMRKGRSHYLQMLGLLTIPGAVLITLRPDLIRLLLSFISLEGIGAGTSLKSSLLFFDYFAKVSPFLGAVYYDLGYGQMALTLVTIPLAVYFAYKRRSLWVSFLLLWFFLVWIATPYTDIAWRFAKIAVIPLSLLWPVGLSMGLTPIFSRFSNKRIIREKGKKIRTISWTTPTNTVLVILVVASLLFTSPTYFMLRDVSIAAPQISQNQREVYAAMNWLAINSSKTVNLVGLNDWRFLYFTPMYGRTITVFFNNTVLDVISFAVNHRRGYILVSNYFIPGPDTSGSAYNRVIQELDEVVGVKRVFSNPSVKIYQLTG